MFKRKLIGRGSFTRAYQISETDVEIISSCPTKECYAMFSQGSDGHGRNPFAPKIERNYDKENAYLMPLYPKIKAPKKQLNARAYQIYQCLRALKYDGYFPNVNNYFLFVKAIEKSNLLTEEEKENIISLAGDVCNAVEPKAMSFEISPRNITCDEEGNLILLDCFFCRNALASSRKR